MRSISGVVGQIACLYPRTRLDEETHSLAFRVKAA